MNHKYQQRRAIRQSRSMTLCVLLTLGISACSQSPIRPGPERIDASRSISIKYEVQRGDSLVKIASRLTGNASNWAEIAKINGITEPRLMHIGRVLIIPGHLVAHNTDTADTISQTTQSTQQVEPPGKQTVSAAAADESTELTRAEPAPAAKHATKVSTPEKDWIFQASSLPGELEVEAVVHRANANRRFEIERIDEQQFGDSTESAQSPVLPNRKIRVIGTYYPKGIYSQPSYTSTLMMRVAPGTQLELEQSFGDWLQIRTEKGSGYIRAIDAEIMGAAGDGSILLSNNG